MRMCFHKGLCLCDEQLPIVIQNLEVCTTQSNTWYQINYACKYHRSVHGTRSRVYHTDQYMVSDKPCMYVHTTDQYMVPEVECTTQTSTWYQKYSVTHRPVHGTRSRVYHTDQYMVPEVQCTTQSSTVHQVEAQCTKRKMSWVKHTLLRASSTSVGARFSSSRITQ